MPSRSDKGLCARRGPSGWRSSAAARSGARLAADQLLCRSLDRGLACARGLTPEAMLAFTARLDFEGDQFTSSSRRSKMSRALYGFVTHELSVYEDLEGHLAGQCARRMVMVESDAFFPPIRAACPWDRAVEDDDRRQSRRPEGAPYRLFPQRRLFPRQGEGLCRVYGILARKTDARSCRLCRDRKADFPALTGRELRKRRVPARPSPASATGNPVGLSPRACPK